MTQEQQPEGPTQRTQYDPVVKRLMRQARQYDHARNHATNETASNLLSMQYNFIVAITELGMHPEKWDLIAAQLIEVNVEMLAQVVAAGVAPLPPAQYDHD
jgi:hypothetical protein